MFPFEHLTSILGDPVRAVTVMLDRTCEVAKSRDDAILRKIIGGARRRRGGMVGWPVFGRARLQRDGVTCLATRAERHAEK